MVSHSYFLHLLNEKNLSALQDPNNPRSNPKSGVSGVAVLPDEETGKYEITYTVFKTRTDVLNAGYYGQNATYHVVEQEHYLQPVENAFINIMQGSFGAYSVLFQDVSNIEFKATTSGVGTITLGQSYAASSLV